MKIEDFVKRKYKTQMVGLIFVSLFGLAWCGVAIAMGAGFMAPFGLLFAGFAAYMAYESYQRMNDNIANSVINLIKGKGEKESSSYCPYCGFELDDEYAYCPKCGKRIEK